MPSPVLRRRPSRLLSSALLALSTLLFGCGAAPTATLTLGETRPLEAPFGPKRLPSAHTVWLELINHARHNLDIAQFYIANRSNSRLDRVISAIERASARGVRVRVLVDAKFAAKYPKTLLRLAATANIAVRRFDVGAHMGGVLHAKYFLVDGQRLWLGSQNFDWRSLSHIHELGVKITGAALVAPYQATFEMDWRLAATPASASSKKMVAARKARQSSSVPHFYVATWRGVEVQAAAVGSPVGFLPPALAWELPALVRWIDTAKSHVRLQLLSMHRRARDGSDFPALFSALQRAAERGVRVLVLVAHWSKSRRSAKELGTLQQVPGLTVKFATIPQHSGGFIPFARVIHSKYLVVDSRRAWISTSNGSKGYFYTSRNVGVLVKSARFAAALDTLFLGIWQGEMAEELVIEKSYPKQRVAR